MAQWMLGPELLAAALGWLFLPSIGGQIVHTAIAIDIAKFS
jgi:hypothetical protein